jgi:hypothetical protein
VDTGKHQLSLKAPGMCFVSVWWAGAVRADNPHNWRCPFIGIETHSSCTATP